WPVRSSRSAPPSYAAVSLLLSTVEVRHENVRIVDVHPDVSHLAAGGRRGAGAAPASTPCHGTGADGRRVRRLPARRFVSAAEGRRTRGHVAGHARAPHRGRPVRLDAQPDVLRTPALLRRARALVPVTGRGRPARLAPEVVQRPGTRG